MAQFQVNLETQQKLAHVTPTAPSDADNFAATRSTWLPDILRNNYVRVDGDIITATSFAAKYLRDTYTGGADPILIEL